MKFPARLEGGRFDGDRGVLAGIQELPEVLWAVECPRHDCKADGVHWLSEPPDDGEKYVFDRMDDRDENVAVYLHADLDYDDILGRTEEDCRA